MPNPARVLINLAAVLSVCMIEDPHRTQPKIAGALRESCSNPCREAALSQLAFSVGPDGFRPGCLMPSFVYVLSSTFWS